MHRIQKQSEGTLEGWTGRDGDLEVGWERVEWEGPAQPGRDPLPRGQDGCRKKRGAANHPLALCPIQAVITRQSQSGPEILGTTEGHGSPRHLCHASRTDSTRALN